MMSRPYHTWYDGGDDGEGNDRRAMMAARHGGTMPLTTQAKRGAIARTGPWRLGLQARLRPKFTEGRDSEIR
jgi:hypothetical protein